jgi:hypothetical protein
MKRFHLQRPGRLARRTLVASAATGAAALAVGASPAAAAFPDFTNCPRSTPGVNGCLNIRTTSGEQVIKGSAIPFGAAIDIRGAIATPGGAGTPQVFVPDTGTNGFFGGRIRVPGGLLGIDLPGLSVNDVYAIPELAGPSSAIRVELATATLSMPIKLRLQNSILNSNCHIGSNTSPMQLRLITGTTSPPPPNRPISGRFGTPSFPGNYVVFSGNTNVDNSYSVPGASGCGLFPPPFFGLIDIAVNVKMGLPSAGGNNSIVANNDIAFGGF